MAAVLDKQAGATFNELVVAMGVGIIVVLGYTLGGAQLWRHQTINGNSTIALQLARDKLEELQARRNPADANLCPNGGDTGLGASGASGGIFRRCWTIAPSMLGANLKQVDVTVGWRDFADHEVTLSALTYAVP